MQPHHSTRLQRDDILSPMNNPEAALRSPKYKPFSHTAVEETQSDMPQLSWEAILNEKVTISPGIVSQAEGEDVTVNLRGNVDDCLEDRRIGDKSNAVVRQLVTEELTMSVDEPLDDILWMSYHNA